jgi:hypothetical protein
VDSSKSGKVFFEEKTGLLMDSRDVPRSRRILDKCEQQWEEVPLGAMTLMVVEKATDKGDWIQHTPVYWTEQGCFSEESSRTQKKRAHRVFQQAMTQLFRGNNSDAIIGTLSRVLSLYEWHQPARRALVSALKASGRPAESAVQEALLSRQTQPEVLAEVGFPAGVRLLGMTISTNEVAPGQSFDFTYYWISLTSVKPRLYEVFVNFQKGKERFQNDHVIMENIPAENIEYQPFREVYSYTRHVTVPASVSPGDYQVVVGLVNRVTKERQKPDTQLTVRKKGVELPVIIKVKN